MFNKSTRKWEYKAVNKNNYYDKGIKLNKKGNQGFKITSAPKLKGAFGETDLNNKTIKINKAISKRAAKMKKGVYKKFGMTKKETSVINSIFHETDHAKHPKMRERNIRKLAKRQVAGASRRTKAKMYAKVR